MELLLLIPVLAAVQAAIIKPACDGPIINGIRNQIEVLITDLDRPYLLATDYSNNTVYFSYGDRTADKKFKTVKFNLSTKEHVEIDGVENGFAQCVDAATNDVYIGSNDGIYKLDKATNEVEYFGAKGYDIWTIFFQDNIMYFADYPSYFVYTLKDGKVSRFEDLKDTKADNFILDNDTMFFSNYTGLYSQKLGTRDAVYYEGTAPLAIRGVMTDRKGDVYAAIKEGIYVANKKDHVLEKYLEVHNAYGVAFDSQNNLVYSNHSSVMRLLPCDDMNPNSIY